MSFGLPGSRGRTRLPEPYLHFDITTGSLLFRSGRPLLEAMRLDGSGRLLINTTSAINTQGPGVAPYYQIHGAGVSAQSAWSITRWPGAAATSPSMSMSKSRGAAVGTFTIVANGDQLGQLKWYGDDGTQFVIGAQIQALVDAAPAANTIPGRLQFHTSDAAGTLQERLRINSVGIIDANTGGSFLQWAGQKRVTADVTFTSTTALATVTGLSVNVLAGRTYSFEAYLSFTDAAAGGIQAAIAGTATATDIRYDGFIVDSAANGIKGNTQAAALGTAVASSTTTGTAGLVLIKGTITVNAAGTLLVQAAQNTSNATATTIKRGSYFIVHDMP